MFAIAGRSFSNLLSEQIIKRCKNGTGSMDRTERRRKRLQALIQEVGSQKDLADLAGTAPSYISQLVTGARDGFGEDLAIRLEKAAGKPDGWMDQWLPDEGGYAAAHRPPDWFLLDLLGQLPGPLKKSLRQTIIESAREAVQVRTQVKPRAKKSSKS